MKINSIDENSEISRIGAGQSDRRSLSHLLDSGAIHTQTSPGTKNVLVVVFDAWSAYNMSLYGYGRETTPNLARLADKAVVYHNHFAGGNFTTPGTASLLTGSLPWSHRAFRYNSRVAEPYANQNLFSAFQNHYRISYSHNPLVNTFFDQFRDNLDEYVPQYRLFLLNDGLIQNIFKNDQDIATVSQARP
jgi:glucan phosphoethanolaminetransferase (alkaline phosphatase superfamily)